MNMQNGTSRRNAEEEKKILKKKKKRKEIFQANLKLDYKLNTKKKGKINQCIPYKKK